MKSYGTATSEKKAQKLELIISTACKLFADKDYQHVCMEEIAQTAGVGKGTIYIYFSSKEDLYFSIIRYRLGNLLEILEKAYSGRVDTIKNLRSFVIHIHKFMTKHPFFYRLWKKEEGSIDSADDAGIFELKEQIYRMVMAILKQGQEEGVLREHLNHELVAHLILGMADALKRSPQDIYKREKSVDELLDVLLKGISTGDIDARPIYQEYRHITEPIDEA